MKYKILNPNTEWKPAYLMEITTGNISYSKYESKAKDFYNEEFSEIEKLLSKKGFKFEKIGFTLEKEVPKEKAVTVRRKKD